MLVEINLLPRREKPGITFLIVVLTVAILTLFTGIMLTIEYMSTQKQIKLTEQKLESTKQLRAVEEQKLTQSSVTVAVQDLVTMVELIKNLPLSSLQILDHFVARLPERGYFLSYTYTGPTQISLTVQFDSIYEVSSYLHRLNESKWVTDVKMPSVITKPVGTSDAPDTDTKLPRYVAQFDITLNPVTIKSDEKEKN